jgi:hypothetical protein
MTQTDQLARHSRAPPETRDDRGGAGCPLPACTFVVQAKPVQRRTP